MTRKKVKLRWIANDSARKASLKKRRAGLLKKVEELTVLCGVNAFIIISDPEEENPSIWPDREAVVQLMRQFEAVPEMDRCKKMLNQETYLKERTSKLYEQTLKQNRKNQELEMTHLMHQIFHGGRPLADLHIGELSNLLTFIEGKIKENEKPTNAPGGPSSPPREERGGVDALEENILNPNEAIGGACKILSEAFQQADPWSFPSNRSAPIDAAPISNIGSDHGLLNMYGGGNDMRLQPYENYGGSDVGLPYGRPGHIKPHDLPHYGSFGGNTSSTGTEIQPPQPPRALTRDRNFGGINLGFNNDQYHGGSGFDHNNLGFRRYHGSNYGIGSSSNVEGTNTSNNPQFYGNLGGTNISGSNMNFGPNPPLGNEMGMPLRSYGGGTSSRTEMGQSSGTKKTSSTNFYHPK